jgi:hypothetical protein
MTTHSKDAEIARLQRKVDAIPTAADWERVSDELDREADARTKAEARVTALTAALRDLIDAIPEQTLVDDPPLRCWVDEAERVLGRALGSEAP